MYRKILIANRADCAIRLIRACHAENIEACLICGRDDCAQAALAEADDVVYTGMSREAYTSIDNILEAAISRDCEAVLPGWGFLSEDFSFARRCRHLGLHFIGPKTHHIQLFGDKLKTIQLLSQYMPATSAVIRCDAEDFENWLTSSGYMNWMLKSRFGGGGKGLKRFYSHADLCAYVAEMHAPGDYYAEPLIEDARHIEFQFFGDGYGGIDFMGARDCTPQVHHQKWLELSVDISSSPSLSRVCDIMIRAFSELKYQSWGTVEFLVKGEDVALLEVNPRLQVEHGVTEMVLNTDMVRRAIRLSCMGRQGFERVGNQGAENNPEHAESMEFRLYARSAGMIHIGFEGFEWPHHPYESDSDYRLESAYRSGDMISGIYDGMLARFIVRSPHNQAQDKLKSWLQTLHVEGIETNLSLRNSAIWSARERFE